MKDWGSKRIVRREEEMYPKGTQVLKQLVSGGHAQEDRADPLTAQTPGCKREETITEKQESNHIQDYNLHRNRYKDHKVRC